VWRDKVGDPRVGVGEHQRDAGLACCVSNAPEELAFLSAVHVQELRCLVKTQDQPKRVGNLEFVVGLFLEFRKYCTQAMLVLLPSLTVAVALESRQLPELTIGIEFLLSILLLVQYRHSLEHSEERLNVRLANESVSKERRSWRMTAGANGSQAPVNEEAVAILIRGCEFLEQSRLPNHPQTQRTQRVRASE